MEPNNDFWKFVEEHLGEDPAGLRLKYHGKGRELEILQIECRRKFGKKLAETLARDPHFLFPSVLAGEQSTSDLFAAYHASLAPEGTAMADLTAGLGIDAIHVASRAKSVVALDIDAAKTAALAYNAGNLGCHNVLAMTADCRDFLAECGPDAFDTLYIDPARRDDSGARVFALADCQPSIADLLPLCKRAARTLIAKASPMLDITQTLRDLPCATRAIAVGNATECKELVIVADLRQEGPTTPLITAMTITPAGTQEFSFTLDEERAAAAEMRPAMPKEGGYLLEPYPAVMKAAPFGFLAKRYGCAPLHLNTHLYYSDAAPEGFPGDATRIEKILPYESKHIKRLKKEYPALQVATRNFDVGADTLRKKLGVRDGGNKRLFAVTLANGGKAMIVCG